MASNGRHENDHGLTRIQLTVLEMDPGSDSYFIPSKVLWHFQSLDAGRAFVPLLKVDCQFQYFAVQWLIDRCIKRNVQADW